jgi:hypothetical protein
MMPDILELLEGLRRTPKILSAFVQSIPAGKRDLRRGEGFWTVSDTSATWRRCSPCC